MTPSELWTWVLDHRGATFLLSCFAGIIAVATVLHQGSVTVFTFLLPAATLLLGASLSHRHRPDTKALTTNPQVMWCSRKLDGFVEEFSVDHDVLHMILQPCYETVELYASDTTLLHQFNPPPRQWAIELPISPGTDRQTIQRCLETLEGSKTLPSHCEEVRWRDGSLVVLEFVVKNQRITATAA